MKVPTTRSYKYKHVDMLLAASTIIENTKNHKDYLQSRRASWTDIFLEEITARVDTAVSTYLGIDTAKELRQKTQKVYGILNQSNVNLAEIKVQIEVDYRKEPEQLNEILNQLGFKKYPMKTIRQDQQAAISLLYQFNTNLTDELKTKLIANGVEKNLLEDTVGLALKLKNANVEQEVSKSTKRQLSQEARNEFNEIYNEALGIAMISRKFYKGNRVMMDQFSFQKIIGTLKNYQNPDTPKTT